jgi:hypothetical protein
MDIFKSVGFWNKYGVQKLFVLYLFLQLFTFFAETTKFNKGAGWDGERYLTISKYGLEDLKRRESSWHIVQSYVPVVFYNIGVKTLGMPNHSSAVVKTLKAYTLLLNILIFILLYSLIGEFTNNINTQLLVIILYLFNYSILKWSNFDPVGREATTIFLFLLGFILFIKKYKILFSISLVLLFFNHYVIAFGLLMLIITVPLNKNTEKLEFKEFFFADFMDKLFWKLRKYNTIILVFVSLIFCICLIFLSERLYILTTDNLLYGVKPIFNNPYYMMFTYFSNVIYLIYLIYIFNAIAIEYSHNVFVIRNITPFLMLIFLIVINIFGNSYYRGAIIGLTSVGKLFAVFGIKPFEYFFSHFYYWGFIFLFILLYIKEFLISSMKINFLYGILIFLLMIIFSLSAETRMIHGLVFLFVPVVIRVLDNSHLKNLNISVLLIFNVLLSRFYINLNNNTVMYFSTPGYFNSEAGYIVKITSSILVIITFMVCARRTINYK